MVEEISVNKTKAWERWDVSVSIHAEVEWQISGKAAWCSERTAHIIGPVDLLFAICWAWTSFPTPLCLSFLKCKTGMRILPSELLWGLKE